MGTKTISVNELVSRLHRSNLTAKAVDEVIAITDELKPAEKRGEWLDGGAGRGISCSYCGHWMRKRQFFPKFCEGCGAFMEGARIND